MKNYLRDDCKRFKINFKLDFNNIFGFLKILRKKMKKKEREREGKKEKKKSFLHIFFLNKEEKFGKNAFKNEN